MRLDCCGQTRATATDHHNVNASGLVRVDTHFGCQRFAGFQHGFGHRFFDRFTLAGCTGNGIHVRGVCIQNTGADLFEAGDKLNVLGRARSQFNVGDAVGLQADVNHQFVAIVPNILNKHARFKFRFTHAHIADHRLHQRETPQRLRDA